MPKVVRMIPATKIHEFEEISPTKQRRVVGYARVSTLLEEQQSSYENQVSYFRKKAEERPDWKLIEIYTDEGITATNTKRRDGFNKMIADALDGKFDLIITKSVSRFARNIVDSISTVRLLKEHGVEVHFEKEDIWTLNSQSELLLTIMSTLAQEESRSISENTKWGIRKSFADGKARVSFSHFLGYDAGFKINEEEAKTVRLIYQLFISGYSLSAICKELERRELPTATGRQKWYISSVLSILTNEKYKGDAMLQKSYTDDFLSKKKVKNYGKVPQFYIEHHHEPIIEPALFDLVQEELRGRKHNHTVSEPLCTKLRCGACNGCFGPKLWHSTDKYGSVKSYAQN